MTNVSVEDSIAVQDLIARYCHHVDLGHADEWAELFTQDGVMSGLGATLTGRDQLRQVPLLAVKAHDGTARHQITNLMLDYGATTDEIRMRASGLMSRWNEGGHVIGFAQYDSTLLKTADGWKLKNHVAKMMPPPQNFV